MSAPKYNIFDPKQVNYVERTPFIQSICGHIDQSDNLEDIVIKSKGASITETEIRQYAQWYIALKNKGARLPKFSKWITGMWAGNSDFATYLAKEGQKAAKRKIIMSGEVLDILRSADTPHFQSCFKRTAPTDKIDREMMLKVSQWDQYQYMPVLIAEECPGIGIAFVDDENGKMMGRQWMHHARDNERDEDILVLTQGYYGCLQGSNLARLLAERGVRIGTRIHAREGATLTKDQRRVEFVGCFQRAVHHDLDTWSPHPVVELMQVK